MAIDGFADSEQSVNDRIDAKIDKDIKALGQIKTMKAMGIGQRRGRRDKGRLAPFVPIFRHTMMTKVSGRTSCQLQK
jgi:hypothetical protein